MIRRIVAELARLVRRREVEGEIREELRDYFDRAVADRMHAGVSRAEATRQTHAEFGNPTVARETAARGGWSGWTAFLGSDLRQDLGYALRHMRRTPGFTLLVLVILSFGVGVGVATASFVRGLLALPGIGMTPDDRLVSVVIQQIGKERSSDTRIGLGADLSRQNIAQLRARVPELTALGGMTQTRFAVEAGAGSQRMDVAGVTGEYFAALGVKPLRGRLFAFGDFDPQPHVAVVSERLWRTQMGGTDDAVGRTIRVNGMPFTVVGIGPERFVGPFHYPVAVWIPRGAFQEARELSSRATTAKAQTAAQLARDSLPAGRVIARLRDGASVDATQRAIATAASVILRSDSTRMGAVSVGPVRMLDGTMLGTQDMIEIMMMLFALAVVVLVLACTNVSALLLGRGMARRREIAVRLSLGASRSRIVRQLLTEGALLSVAAGVVAVLVLLLVRDRILAASGGFVPIYLPLDWATVAAALAIAIVTGMAFSLAPALDATRVSVGAILKDAAAGVDRKRGRLHRWMIATQLAVSQPLLLLTSLALSLVIVDSPWRSGYTDPERVLGVRIESWTRATDSVRGGRMVQVREWLEAVPGVERVTVVEDLPMAFGSMDDGTEMTKLVPADGPLARSAKVASRGTEVRTVEPGFFATVGSPPVLGREFDVTDGAQRRTTAILPERVARAWWPGENPIGKTLLSGSAGDPVSTYKRPVIVVGVVPDPNGSAWSSRPIVYYAKSSNDMGGSGTVLLARTRVPAADLVTHVRQGLRAIDPDMPVPQVESLASALKANLGVMASIMMAAGLVPFFALGLAALGLAGIITFTMAQRTREIGIRMALGATSARVVRRFVMDGLGTAIRGLLIGLPLALALTLPASQMTGATRSVNVVSVVTAQIVLLLVALVASWLPARGAARVDPMIALRAE